MTTGHSTTTTNSTVHTERSAKDVCIQKILYSERASDWRAKTKRQKKKKNETKLNIQRKKTTIKTQTKNKQRQKKKKTTVTTMMMSVKNQQSEALNIIVSTHMAEADTMRHVGSAHHSEIEIYGHSTDNDCVQAPNKAKTIIVLASMPFERMR